jgi:hypothetical protein
VSFVEKRERERREEELLVELMMRMVGKWMECSGYLYLFLEACESERAK